jgi:uncharacterized protein YdaU (DUF1376 family)
MVAPNPAEHTAVEGDVMPASSSKSSRSPAFQFYPKDYISSTKVRQMSNTERGVYVSLLCYCWLDDGLPTDLPSLARLAEVKLSQFERMWTKGPLHECFYEKNGRFHNERLDRERKAQADFRRKQKERADKRWHPKDGAVIGNATALRGPHTPGNALQSAICNLRSANKEKSSAEPPSDSTPVVFTFPTVGKSSAWVLTQGRIDGWRGMYPNVDVMAECRKASAWIEANPERRKTAKGMSAFLVNWLNRAADRGGVRVSGPEVKSSIPSAEETRRRYLSAS